jgi:polyferredoxin
MSTPVADRGGSVKPRLRGVRRLITHQTLRRLIQGYFALFILVLIVRHAIAGEGNGIGVPAPEAYCPFGGLETLYRYIVSAGRTIPHTHLSNLVLLVAVLVTGFLFRSGFCGWICPLGFIQEMVNTLSRFLQKRFVPLRKAMRKFKEQSSSLTELDKALRYTKYFVLVWAVVGAAYYGIMVFRNYDPWAALINIYEFSFSQGTFILILTLVASLIIDRPWCRYICPLGAASCIVGKLSPVYLKREESSCTSCKVCTKACPMGLEVHTAEKITSADCISCLECVGACPRNGALEVKVGIPGKWE